MTSFVGSERTWDLMRSGCWYQLSNWQSEVSERVWSEDRPAASRVTHLNQERNNQVVGLHRNLRTCAMHCCFRQWIGFRQQILWYLLKSHRYNSQSRNAKTNPSRGKVHPWSQTEERRICWVRCHLSKFLILGGSINMSNYMCIIVSKQIHSLKLA